METQNLQSPSQFGQYAQWYAQLGLAVFPLVPKTKIPRKGSNGFKDATKDPEVILRTVINETFFGWVIRDGWFVVRSFFPLASRNTNHQPRLQKHPFFGVGRYISQLWLEVSDSNIAVATGGASGFIVIDIDGDAGVRSFNELQSRLGLLPAIALSRIGGLRCPNEVLRLRWEDVNWEFEKFYVRSPKTKRYEGKEGRWVPIFPELYEELRALFESEASVGREYVINRYRDASQNLRTTFGKIVKRAGLEMFPQPFRNLRRTRSNEVYREFGAYKESEWIGHSRKVRDDHYLSMTDNDFREAARRQTPVMSVERPVAGVKSGKKTADFDRMRNAARFSSRCIGRQFDARSGRRANAKDR